MRHGRRRGIVAIAGITAIAAGLLVAVLGAPASATSAVAAARPAVVPHVFASGRVAVNPLTLAGGFTVYAIEDAVLGNTEFEGSIAVGDELRITHDATYQFAHVIAGTGGYVLPTIDEDPTRVLVGSYGPDPASNRGRAQITSLGATEPSQIGDLKVVERGGPFVSSTRASWLRYALSQGTDDPPLIDAQNQVYPDDSVPPTSSDGHGSIYTHVTDTDTAAVVASYVEANAQATKDEIAQCLIDIVDPSNLIGYPVEIAEDVGDRIVLGTLSPDQPNVLQYADIEGARLLQFADGTPGPTNPLIIHVEPGTTSILPPAIDPEGTYSPYVFWDLSQVTGPVDISTGGRGDGSIYAPDADLSITAQPWDGQIVANSVAISGGELHSYMFAGAVPCDAPVDEGTFSVAKALDGLDPEDLTPGAVFEVRYLALDPEGNLSTGVLEVGPDGTPSSPAAGFPFGTRVAVFEIPPDDDVLPPGLAWTDVTWSGDTTFTIDATHPSVDLVVTDTAALIPAGFSVTKSLTGSGATTVPSGEQFTLEYEVNDGGPIELMVTPGEPAVVDDLAAGDLVSITETDFPDVDGITWGTPTWTVDGQALEPDASGDVQFTLVGGESIALELTNTANAVGWISVSKTLIGDGVDLIPDGTEFPLVYTLDGGTESTVTIPSDEVITFDALPAGTVVTVHEGALPEIPGIEWGTPGWTIDGIPQVPDADGDVTFVVQPGTTISISLTNTANGFGSLSLVKDLTGPASDLVPADTAYPIEYRVSTGAVATAELTAGVPVEASGLPTGVPVSLRESAPPEIPGVAWGEPIWTVDGAVVAPDDDGWVTFVAEAGTTVELELENTATLAPGAFTVTKELGGDGASTVPDDTEYTVGYRVDDGATQNLVVRAGETTTVADLPDGATVTFTELTPPEVAGVDWGTPTWEVDGSPTSDPTITIGAGRTVSVSLINTADVPTTPDTAGGLPSTGVDPVVPLIVALAAVLLGLLASGAASRRRRRAMPSHGS